MHCSWFSVNIHFQISKKLTLTTLIINDKQKGIELDTSNKQIIYEKKHEKTCS